MEELVGVVKGQELCRSLVVTVPHHIRKEGGLKKGDRFAVKTDEQGRIIYEPIRQVRGAD